MAADPAVVGAVVVPIARGAIAEALGVAAMADESPPWLQAPAATFVTLKMLGELRGCIGSLEARRSLLVDLKENAVAAALRDPRFPPLAQRELVRTRVEISILSPAEPIACRDETDLHRCLRPGIDGIVISYRSRRATFLPQVWEQLPEVGDFMAALKDKAGLPADFWSAAIEVSRYTVAKYTE